MHSPQSGCVPDAVLGHDGQILAQHIDPSSHSIPAVHHTSDSPPPSSIPSEPESTRAEMIPFPSDQSSSTPAETPPVDALEPAEALSAIPERIGYLKDVCGLDFGWGPSSMMQWLLEHIHIDGGVSWATSIILLAASARLFIFIPMIQASDAGAKFKAAEPVIGPVRERMKAAYAAGNHNKMAEARAELKALSKEYGLSSWKMMIPVLIQIPLQFGGFRVLRNMAELPVPALEQENWLWAHDLTLSDPYFVIPFVNAAVIYLTIKRGGETGTSQVQGGLMIVLSYLMPVISFIFMSFQPGAVQLYFFVSSLVAFSQTRILTNKLFRKVMRMHPTVPKAKKLTFPTVTSSASPGNHTTIPSVGPAGLKLYQPPRPTSPIINTTQTTLPSSPSNPQPNISIIDKVVNRTKSQATEARESWDSIWKNPKEKKQKEAEINKIQTEAQRYESRRAREDEWRREEINRERKERGERRG